MVRRLLILGFLGATAFGGIGCRLCDRNRRPLFDWYRDKDPIPQRRGVERDGILREPRATDPYIPSTDLPSGGGSGDLPPPFVPESRSNRVDPLNPKRELLLPDSDGPAASRGRTSNGLLGAPQAAADGRESKKIADAGNLNGYSLVKSGVASGRVPTAAGLDRLKKAGFKTVVYLHAPAADITLVRREVEAKGLTFVAVPVSEDRLSEAMAAFNDAVASKAARSLYVCDDDGVRTGSLWYVHFRMVEYANDDTARLLAAPLGLTEPPSAEQTTFWVAMRTYLSTR